MRRKKKPQEVTLHDGWAMRMRAALENPSTREGAAVEIGDWARDLCLTMGSSLDTAYAVGGFLASGVAKTWEGVQP